MPLPAFLTLGLLAVTFLLIIKTRIPTPAIFLGALTAAITLRLAPTDELLKGFSNQGMLTVGVLFIVAAGMYSTGAITMILDKLLGLPKRLISAQLKILPTIAVGSGFLNNTPLIAMMIPVVRDLCKATGLPAKHLYLPLSFASILGGMCTIIGTSTNLVIAGLVLDTVNEGAAGLPTVTALKMFDPAWVGVPIAATGIAFMILFGKFFLPRENPQESTAAPKRRYGAEFEVAGKSRLIGKTMEETGLVNSSGFDLLCIRRGNKRLTGDLSIETFEAKDLLSFSSDVESLVDLWRKADLVPHLTLFPMETDRHTHHLVKVVIARRSMAVGRRLAELPRAGSPYLFKIVAVSRDGGPVDGLLEDIEIEAGDNAVLEVNDAFLYQSQIEHDFSLTKPLDGFHLQRTDRAVEAALITLAMVVSAAMGWMSMLNAGLLASGAMLATGCLTFRTAAKSIDWGTLVVIACAIGLESTVKQSGLAERIAHLLTTVGGDNPYLALGVVFLGCTFMTNVITNNAAAAFMFPIALATASQLGVSFMPFVITLMISASCAFITPTGYQTNLMIWGPGGYDFMDFVKIGTVMTIIVAVMTIAITPLVFKF